MVVVFTADIKAGDPERDIVEAAFPGREIVSEVSGVVQFRLDYPSEVIGVIWDTAEAAPELEVFLDELFAMVESGGAEVNDRGPLVTSVKDDHEMVYQHVNITDQGRLTTGVVGSWYCDEANRIYIFNYLERIL